MIAKHPTETFPDQHCPICGSPDTAQVCELPGMPVHVGRHWPTAEAALSCPRGDIRLRFCRRCGMLWNGAFDPALVDYDGQYDNSLYFSEVHRKLARRAAARLIRQHAIRRKEIIEIGCGTGEFLMLLCELGENRGVGFDPSYRPDTRPPEDVRFVRELYGAKHAAYRADLVCSRYLLEHVAQPVSLLRQLHRTLRQQDDALVYFEVPNAWLIFRQGMVWDLIYEHFANFCRSSLVRAFEEAGFSACDVGEGCEGQVLWIEARSGPPAGASPASEWDDRRELESAVVRLRDELRRLLNVWEDRFTRFRRKGQRVVVWGAGAKGISFLNMLGVREQIRYVVDVNPRKAGGFIPCTGQEIVDPRALPSIRPDVVLVMNPLYESEIRQMIQQQSLNTEVVCV